METIKIEGLHFDKRYAGIFITRATNVATEIRRNLQNHDVSIWLYESPAFFLCIIIGDEHTESVIKWFQAAQEIATGSSMIAAILANGRFQPSRIDSCFFRIQIEDIQLDELIKIIGEHDLFCLLLPHSMEICMLTDSLNCAKLLSYPDIPKPIKGFVLREAIQKAEKSEIKKRPSKSYDPIGAQIGELLNRYSVSVTDLIKDTANAWENALHTEPPSEFTYLDQTLDRRIEYIRDAINELPSDKLEPSEINYLFNEIDITANLFKHISRSYANLKDQLRDYHEPSDHWNFSTGYLELVTPLVLRAAKQYIRELTDRATISDKVDIIPIFADDFTMYPLIHEGLLSILYFNETDSSISKMKTKILTLPREMKLRIGSFPVLAHGVGHILIDHQHKDIINRIAHKILSGEHEKTFHGIFNHMIVSQNSKEGFLNDVKNYQKSFKTMNYWLNEIFCDLIATALSGPAYVYAFARFTTGTLGHFLSKEKKHYPTHPSIDIRITLCIELLNSLGFAPLFTSQFIKSTSTKMDDELVGMIFSLIGKPYTIDQHLGITEIQKALASGAIVCNHPILIFNALWDSVIRKKGYINEIATLLSISNNYQFTIS